MCGVGDMDTKWESREMPFSQKAFRVIKEGISEGISFDFEALILLTPPLRGTLHV